MTIDQPPSLSRRSLGGHAAARPEATAKLSIGPELQQNHPLQCPKRTDTHRSPRRQAPFTPPGQAPAAVPDTQIPIVRANGTASALPARGFLP